MLSMSMKEFWIILREMKNHTYFGMSEINYIYSVRWKGNSPVVGSKPVEGCVQLDDVSPEEDIISNLRKEKIWLQMNTET